MRKFGALLLAGLVLAVMLVPSIASASPPNGGAVYGKVPTRGALAVPYADSSNLSFPSTPPTSTSYLTDGDVVYDTEVSVQVVDTLPTPVTLSVVTEIWSSTETFYPNETAGGANASLGAPVTIRLGASWSNATVTALPGRPGSVSIPLASVTSPHQLEVRVGNATWRLVYLTVATSAATGIYTAGGIWGFSLALVGVSFVAIFVSAGLGIALVRRVHSVPKVGLIWPVLWILVPVLFIVLDYVPTNQALAGLSPLVIPFPVAIASVPYWARRFAGGKYSRLQRLEFAGRRTRKLEGIIKLVDTKEGLRVAPRTWRGVLYSLFGVPLPLCMDEKERVLGVEVQVQPEGLDVGDLFEDRALRSDSKHEYWVDTRAPVVLKEHNLRWTREHEIEKAVDGPEGKTTMKVKRRSFSPHIELGYLKARWIPTRPMLELLADVRSAENLLHDSRADQLALAEMRGSMSSRIREAVSKAILQQEARYRRHSEPRTDEEIDSLHERNLPRRLRGGEEGPKALPSG